MRLQQEIPVIEQGNLPDECHTFQISSDKKNQALIAEILQSKLYTNPVRAVCRELISNAVDSHNEAGKTDAPITVIPPSRTQPFMVVQDYGVGISPGRMLDVFVNLGASTKRDSDEQIGAFGIGAKSPFAYTDSFTIETIWSGTSRTYTAYIGKETDEKGGEYRIAKLQLLTETLTDQCNGARIQVPVRDQDVKNFRQQIVQACLFINPMPDVPGLSDDLYRLREERVEAENYSSPKGVHNLTAVVGCMPYTIKVSELMTLDHAFKTRIGAEDKAFNPEWALHFPIGSLPVSANRETLRYTEETLEAVVQKLVPAVQEAKDVALKKLASQPDLMSAALYAQGRYAIDSGHLLEPNKAKYEDHSLDSSYRYGGYKNPFSLPFSVKVQARHSSGDGREKGDFSTYSASSDAIPRPKKDADHQYEIVLNDFGNKYISVKAWNELVASGELQKPWVIIVSPQPTSNGEELEWPDTDKLLAENLVLKLSRARKLTDLIEYRPARMRARKPKARKKAKKKDCACLIYDRTDDGNAGGSGVLRLLPRGRISFSDSSEVVYAFRKSMSRGYLSGCDLPLSSVRGIKRAMKNDSALFSKFIVLDESHADLIPGHWVHGRDIRERLLKPLAAKILKAFDLELIDDDYEKSRELIYRAAAAIKFWEYRYHSSLAPLTPTRRYLQASSLSRYSNSQNWISKLTQKWDDIGRESRVVIIYQRGREIAAHLRQFQAIVDDLESLDPELAKHSKTETGKVISIKGLPLLSEYQEQLLAERELLEEVQAILGRVSCNLIDIIYWFELNYREMLVVQDEPLKQKEGEEE